jgi:hypothetical protein
VLEKSEVTVWARWRSENANSVCLLPQSLLQYHKKSYSIMPSITILEQLSLIILSYNIISVIFIFIL